MSNTSSRTKITSIRLPLDLLAFANAKLKPGQALAPVIVRTLRHAWGCPDPGDAAQQTRARQAEGEKQP